MESLAEELATMVRRSLTEAHVAAIRRTGTERMVDEGAIFIRAGDPSDRFCEVLEGGFQLWNEARCQACAFDPGKGSDRDFWRGNRAASAEATGARET